MKIGDTVSFCSHDGHRRDLTITALETIHGSAIYRTNEDSGFHVRPESGRHYNVGNRAFWIVEK